MGIMTGIPLAPVDLRVERALEPLDVDTPMPIFSWKLNTSQPGVRQRAYQIWIASGLDLLESGRPDVWDSGKVDESDSAQIVYSGFPLAPKDDFFWKVRIWDQDNRVSRFSDPSSFSTAYCGRVDWRAPWITWEPPRQEGMECPRSIMLFKAFRIVRPVRRARMYVSGLGAYRLEINGRRVGREWFSPDWTDYRKEIQYQVYEVDGYLQDGPNILAITLGNMWWSGRLGGDGGSAGYGPGLMMARMEFELTLTDGSTRLIETDETWRGSLSGVVENSLYDGETWDARMHPDDWSTVKLDDQGWTFARIVDPQPKVRMLAQQCPPVRNTQELQPVSIWETAPGSFVVDFGQNLAGVVRIRARGKAGSRIQLRFAERLHPDGRLDTANLRSARATDTLVLSGTDSEVEWAPMFTYHGFRYIEVTDYPGTLGLEDVTALALHSDVARIGGFSCSSDVMTRVQECVEWGLRSNLISVPTDCPQRDDRLGRTGEAQVIASTACWNFDMLRLYSKWLRDLRLTQGPEGYVADLAPAVTAMGPAAPGWGDAIAVVPWEVFRFTGDRRILIDSLDAIRSWVESMRWHAEDLLYKRAGYGDWMAPEASLMESIGTAYFYRSTWILSKIAEILGERDDVWEYGELAEQIAEAYNAAYFDEATGWYAGRTQTGQVLPLAFGICPESARARVASRLVEDIHAHGDHVTTGFLGTAELLPVLTQTGHVDVAYRLAEQRTPPSWGGMVERGATTIWESWVESEGISRNHVALGSVGRWYFESVAGINPVIPGFRKFRVRPRPGGHVHWAEAWHDTPYGRVVSNWRLTGPKVVEMGVRVPPNTEAEIWVPYAGEARRVYESGVLVLTEGLETPGLAERGLVWLGTRDGAEVFRAGGGSYQFSAVV
jgi:alpha-L-rhamnosidase